MKHPFWKKTLAGLLAVTMVGQSCFVTVAEESTAPETVSVQQEAASDTAAESGLSLEQETEPDASQDQPVGTVEGSDGEQSSSEDGFSSAETDATEVTEPVTEAAPETDPEPAQEMTEIGSESETEQDAQETEAVTETAAETEGESEIESEAESETEQEISLQASAGGFDLVASPTMNNVLVEYVYFNDATGAANNDFVAVNGAFTITDFVMTSRKSGYIVFFVKPAENYLLTGLGANGRGDIYSLSGTRFGNISNYPGLSTVVQRAKDRGYIACFGYSRMANNPSAVNAVFEIDGVKPSIAVSAVSSKSSDIVPGEQLTFTVTITPQTEVNGKELTVNDVRTTSVKINGRDCRISDLTAVGDGTYVGTVSYRTTVEDCNSGKIRLDVDASVDYSYSLGVKDSTTVTGTANTTATIQNSAYTVCDIAPRKGVLYHYTYEGADDFSFEEYPEEIKTPPVDGDTYYRGDEVTLADIPLAEGLTLRDDQNGGFWTFDGWYIDGEKAADKAEMEDEILMIAGKWKFYQDATVTVTKIWVGDADYVQSYRPAQDDFTVTLTDSSQTFVSYPTGTWQERGTDGNVWVSRVKVPAYEADGSKITYQVSETEPGSYKLENVGNISVTPADDPSITLRNTLKTGKLTITKQVEGLSGEAVLDDSFCFTVTGENGYTGNVTLRSGGNSEDAFADLPLGSYTVTETVENTASQKHVYSVDILAADGTSMQPVNGDETSCVVEVTEDGAELHFTNTAKTAELDLNGTLGFQAEKILKGRDLQAGEFSFEVRDGEGQLVLTGTNEAADGEAADVNFKLASEEQGTKLVYDTIGVYEYTVREVVPENTLTERGITFDDTVFEVQVTVAPDENGNLQAAVNTPEDIVFRNTYSTTDASFEIYGKKILNAGGRQLRAGEFSFTVTEVADAEGTPLEGAVPVTVSNDFEGNFVCNLTYTLEDEGVHYYKVEEKMPETPEQGMTYSKESYLVTVEVSHDGEGNLKAEYAGGRNISCSFTNTYTASVDSDAQDGRVEACKMLEGRTLKAGEFSFQLTANAYTPNAPMPENTTAVNGADGKVIFDQIPFTQNDIGKSYDYDISEIIPTEDQRANGMTYDTHTYTVRLTVTDAGNGRLAVEQTLVPTTEEREEEIPVFVNTFSRGNRGHISGIKTWVDGSNSSNTRPESLELTLKADGIIVDTGEESGITLSWSKNGNVWQYTYSGEKLYRYTEEGTQITYTVEEAVPKGYKQISASSNERGGTDFVNALEDPEDVTLSGTKTWVDNNNAMGLRPDASTIGLTLYRSANGSEDTVVDAVPTWNGNTYQYTGLKRYDEEGYAYRYHVVETKVPEGYVNTASVPAASGHGYDFTNTLTVGQLTLSKTVRKPDQMEITDTFTFTVSGFADDVTEVKDADGNVYAVSADQDPAQRSITVALKDGEEAVLIVPVGSYTVSEDGAVGGIVKIADGHTYAIRESSKQMTVNPGVTSSASFVNTLADEKQITVTKVWEDQDNRYELRPAENQFQVVLNGNNTDYTVDKWILSEDANVWTGTVTVPAYDKSGEKITYTVTETSTGGSLENYGQDANNTTEITPADSEEQVNLINRLKTGSLTVTKTVAGLDETKLRDDSFTFTVYPAEGEDAQPIASISGVRHGETHTFEKLPYGSYRIVETTDAGAKHVYTTTVSVDNAAQTGGTECQAVLDETHKAVTAAFTNTAESVELDLTASTQIQVSKILKGRDLSEGEFKFVVKDVTDPNAPKQLAEGTNAAAKDGEAAVVNFPAAVLTFDTVGEYHYLLSEVVPENGTENGVIYDTNEYEVTVEVTIGENGALTAAVDGGKNLTFTNIYDTSRASLVLKGKKELRAGGRLLKDREFTFEVVESDEDGNPLDGASVQQVKNAADGSFAYEFVFDKSQKGTHYYRIKEAVPSDPETGMTYDTKSYVIQIDVADDGKGTLTASRADSNSADLTFVNTYAASGSFAVTAKKVIENRELTEGEFTFTLVPVADAPMPEGKTSLTAVNGADGTVAFEAIPYTQEQIGGTYYYKVTEVVGSLNGVSYDETEHYVIVKVEDGGNGTLAISQVSPVQFTNVFDQKYVTISGTKTWVMPEGSVHPEITLELYRDKETTPIAYATLESGTGSTQSYQFKGRYPKYAAGEIEGYTGVKDSHEFVYTVKEAAVDGYTVSYGEKNQIVNTISQEMIEVKGQKVWNTVDGETVPEITVELLRDGKIIDSIVLKDGETEISFKNLPRYAAGEIREADGTLIPADGHEFVYTLAEKEVKGYTSFVDQETYTVTNTAQTTSLTVTKSWTDGQGNVLDETLVPDELQVQVLRNGTEYGEAVTLTKEERWSYTFENLPMYDENEQPYSYAVREMTAEGFTLQSGGDTVQAAMQEDGSFLADLNNQKNDETPHQPEKTHEITAGAVIEGTEQLVEVGGTLTYTISYYNHQNQTAEVSIEDVLPAGVIYESAAPDAEADGQIVRWTIADVKPFTGGTVSVTVQVTEDALEQTENNVLENTATVSIGDWKQETNVDTVTVAHPAWTVTKTVTNTGRGENGLFRAGDVAEFDIAVTNTGNVELRDLKAAELLKGAAFAEAGHYIVSENGKEAVISVPAGETVHLKAVYTIQKEDLGKELRNVVTVTDGKTTETGEAEIPVDDPDPENGSVTAVKTNINLNGETLYLAGSSFHVALFADEAMTQRVGDVKELVFARGEAEASVVFDELPLGVYYVAETDASGNVITTGTEDGGRFVPVYLDGHKVEITRENRDVSLAFSNQFLVLPNNYYQAKRLTITKEVLDKNGETKNSSETFYVGIFADEAHTQPAENVEQNIIPIEMNGKAAASVSTEVMTEENGETVVLYLAEVTADGTPVDQVKGFGYDAEIDTPTVVFTVMDDEQSATITNWSKSDDTTVTTETSESTETENENTKNGTQNGVKTGDDTPVEMTWLLFVVSAAMLLILGNRRKRQM